MCSVILWLLYIQHGCGEFTQDVPTTLGATNVVYFKCLHEDCIIVASEFSLIVYNDHGERIISVIAGTRQSPIW